MCRCDQTAKDCHCTSVGAHSPQLLVSRQLTKRFGGVLQGKLTAAHRQAEVYEKPRANIRLDCSAEVVRNDAGERPQKAKEANRQVYVS